jgi:hypothetical protein
VIDDRTTYQDFPLPNAANRLEDDNPRLRQCFTQIDGLIKWITDRVDSNDFGGLGSIQALVDAFNALGTAAQTDSTAYATAAQGTTADSALQPGDIGTSVQAYDGDLAALAGLGTAANKVPYFTGAGTAALADITAVARTFLAAATVSAQRTALSLVPGTDVEPADATIARTGATNTFTAKQTFSAGIKEGVASLSGTTPTISSANGTILTWVPGADSAPVDGLSAGESVTLMIDDAADITITWPGGMKWTGGGEPTLETTGENIIELWKVGSTLYGAYAGAA